MKLDESSRGPALRKLMKSRLGRLFEWPKPDVEKTVGPYEPDIFDFFDKERALLEGHFHTLLAGLSDENIDVLADPRTPNSNRLKIQWNSVHCSDISKLKRAEPPWYAGGFGVANYRADFRYWSQMPEFTLNEALLLSLGIEPKHFSDDEIEKLQSEMERGANLWKPMEYLLARRKQMARQFPTYGRGRKISPLELFAWIEQVELDVHPEFNSKYLTARPQKAPELETVRLDHREKTSMLQLIVTMAVGGYGYEPGKPRSQTPKEIENDAAELGIEVSAETVRKYLRSSESQISADWRSPKS